MRGFTLVELLVAVAVAGILAAIAWPGYTAAVHRTQRAEARLALLRVQFLQEHHYAGHNRYSALLNASRTAGGLGFVAEDGSYELAVEVGKDAQTYIATAHARPGSRQSRDHPCQWLSVDELGQRRVAAADGRWRDEDPDRCWG